MLSLLQSQFVLLRSAAHLQPRSKSKSNPNGEGGKTGNAVRKAGEAAGSTTLFVRVVRGRSPAQNGSGLSVGREIGFLHSDDARSRHDAESRPAGRLVVARVGPRYVCGFEIVDWRRCLLCAFLPGWMIQISSPVHMVLGYHREM